MPEYNYSLTFLKAHEQTVQQLVALARDGKAAEVKFEDYNEARSYRVLILNLKRSLAMNHPEMVQVHNILRTKIDRDDTGWWVIRIGPEELLRDKRGKKVRGAFQRMVEPAVSTAILDIPELTQANWEKIQVKLAVAMLPNSDIRQIVIHHIDTTPDNIPIMQEAILEMVRAQFTRTSTDPFTMARKPYASANDALASHHEETKP